MGRLRVLSGEAVCAILRGAGFAEIRRRSSHIVMQQEKKWKPQPSGKKPEKDKDHQRTLKVMAYLQGNEP